MYMIRKPEFIKDAKEARFFPGTFMTFVIAFAVFVAYLLISVVANVINNAFTMEAMKSVSFDAEAYIQFTAAFMLYFEAALIACVLIYTRFIERRPLASLGLAKRRFAHKYFVGFAAGAVLLAINYVPVFLTIPFEYTGFQAAAFLFLGAFIVQSAAEEVLFRGYIMTSLLRRRSALSAVVINTVVFALFHIPFSNMPFIQLLGVTLLGAVLALYFLRTGSLWGAMGLHAAWNFFTCIIVPMQLGQYEIAYAIFNIPEAEIEAPGLVVLQLLILAAAAALLLFAGKNRLVVPMTQEQALLDEADGLAKDVVTDRGQLSYARRLSELAEGCEGKTVALLHCALSNGSPPGYMEYQFGDDMLAAAEALTVQYGESAENYWRRVSRYPAAVSVKNAETRLEEMKRPKNSMYDPNLWFTGGYAQCPMMRWGITEGQCLRLARIADGEAPAEGEEYTAALNLGICRRCPGRMAIAGRNGRVSGTFVTSDESAAGTEV